AYRDVPMLKHPVEVALYMRLIWETKPRTIFEIGSSAGGAAVWMSDLLKTFGIDGQIISIDLKPPAPPTIRPTSSFCAATRTTSRQRFRPNCWCNASGRGW